MTLAQDSNLWLAEALWHLGAVEFGEFTLGRTAVRSPIYLNVRKIIGHPETLRRAADVLHSEIVALQSMRNPGVAHFDLVAGVPLGGLHIATAYSLQANVPLVYLHPGRDDTAIEGVYEPGLTAIIMDDLVTGGGSIAETAARLREAGMLVRDAFVLVDRQQGARERLRAEGINLRAALNLQVILNYLMSCGLIEEDWYRRSMAYLEASRAE
jgi:orotate phosphoribosyltransferase/uridine monophosphate synthetase